MRRRRAGARESVPEPRGRGHQRSRLVATDELPASGHLDIYRGAVVLLTRRKSRPADRHDKHRGALKTDNRIDKPLLAQRHEHPNQPHCAPSLHFPAQPERNWSPASVRTMHPPRHALAENRVVLKTVNLSCRYYNTPIFQTGRNGESANKFVKSKSTRQTFRLQNGRFRDTLTPERQGDRNRASGIMIH